MITLFTLITNPYQSIGDQLAAGLAAIEAGLTSGMSFDTLNDAVYDYVQPLYYPSPDQFDENELKSVLPNAVNSYINSNMDGYTMEQSILISRLIQGIMSTPVESIPDFIADIEDNISKSGLPLAQQVPLLMATAIGQAAYTYWNDQVNDDSTGKWYPDPPVTGGAGYFNANPYANHANIPYWVQAAMIGGLASANKARTYGQLDPPKVIGVDMVSALIGALGVTAGKVMFGWIPRVQVNSLNILNLEKQIITNFGGGNMDAGAFTRTFIGRSNCLVCPTTNRLICITLCSWDPRCPGSQDPRCVMPGQGGIPGGANNL